MNNVSMKVIDPEEAQRILINCQYDGQRKIRDNHVVFLADEMKLGKFKPTAQVVIAKQLDTERSLITNGRHTLSAIVRSGIPQQVVYHEYETANDRETAEVYGAIDVNLSRTMYDQFAAMQLADELGLTPTQLSSLSGGVSVIDSKFTSQRHGRKHLYTHAEQLRGYAEHMHRYVEDIAGMPWEIAHAMHRSVTVGLALVTYKFSAVAYGGLVISNFWNKSTFGTELKADDPRWVAHKHLLTTSLGGGGRTANSRTVITPAYSSRYLANCFNAFVEKRPLTKTLVRDATVPIQINGSFFTGS